MNTDLDFVDAPGGRVGSGRGRKKDEEQGRAQRAQLQEGQVRARSVNRETRENHERGERGGRGKEGNHG